MKNSTKVRLHLSKKLFESLTKEIIKEAKANDGYTVAVKKPKAPKQVKEVNAVADTDKMKRMEGNVPTSTSTTSVQDMNMGNDGKLAIPGLKEKMSSKEKMAKGLYNEVDAEMDTNKMKKIKEMEMNVAEENPMNEWTGTETESSGAIAMIATALGLGIPLATALIKDLMRAKSPEEKKQIIQKKLADKNAGMDKGTDALKEYEHHYEVRNGECRRYNDEGEYTVVSMHYCR